MFSLGCLCLTDWQDVSKMIVLCVDEDNNPDSYVVLAVSVAT